MKCFFQILKESQLFTLMFHVLRLELEPMYLSSCTRADQTTSRLCVSALWCDIKVVCTVNIEHTHQDGKWNFYVNKGLYFMIFSLSQTIDEKHVASKSSNVLNIQCYFISIYTCTHITIRIAKCVFDSMQKPTHLAGWLISLTGDFIKAICGPFFSVQQKRS